MLLLVYVLDSVSLCVIGIYTLTTDVNLMICYFENK